MAAMLIVTCHESNSSISYHTTDTFAQRDIISKHAMLSLQDLCFKKIASAHPVLLTADVLLRTASSQVERLRVVRALSNDNSAY
jgi:hypothetical protein